MDEGELDMLKPPILITGCARSGTSMTAGVLKKCGAWSGNVFGPNKWNRKGMYENVEIRENVIKLYLTLLGVDPKGQNPLPDINKLLPLSNLRVRIETIIKYQGYLNETWFYKGAKMCLIWPVLHDAFPDAKWIIVRRKDESIIHSCMRTAFMNGYENEVGWQSWIDTHKQRFKEMKDNGLNVIEVWPSKFVYGDYSEIISVVESFGLKWDEGAVKDFVSPELYGGDK